jgi:AcrR family transcriptional regulator
MGRWEPNARGRLVQAAMQLFAERGYVETTARDIAERAGLTERTFFRHFADKREILFSNSHELEQLIADAIAAAPASATPIGAIGKALVALDPIFEVRRAAAKKRRALIEAHPELQERELTKGRMLGTAFATALRARGVAEPAASIAAEAGLGVLKIGFERWLDDSSRRTFADHMRDGLAALTAAVTSASPKRAARRRS